MLFSIFCLLKGVFFVVTMLHYLKKFFVAKKIALISGKMCIFVAIFEPIFR